MVDICSTDAPTNNEQVRYCVAALQREPSDVASVQAVRVSTGHGMDCERTTTCLQNCCLQESSLYRVLFIVFCKTDGTTTLSTPNRENWEGFAATVCRPGARWLCRRRAEILRGTRLVSQPAGKGLVREPRRHVLPEGQILGSRLTQVRVLP